MFLDNDGHPLAPVHQCWNDSEAEVVIALLRAHGIEARANSEVPHAILPIIADGLGEVAVLVREEDRETAEQLLAEEGLAGTDAGGAPGAAD